MSGDYQVITSPTVNVHISSTVTSFNSEKRYQKDLTISTLKGKLELVTGGNAGQMVLEVYNKEGHKVCVLDNDAALLGSYQVDDGMRIHVVDKSGHLGEFEDVSKVEKFEISQDDYAKRADSVRAFKQKMKMGQFREMDPEEQKRKDEEEAQKEAAEKTKLDSMKVGNRCEVSVPAQPTKRGTVMYLGTTDFKPGLWVGVKYDEPHGKNDGSVKGKRYFECLPKYGGFTKPDHVTVGDFPELMDDFDDDEM